MRILFMGTPAFAVPSLKALLTAGFSVVAAATQPDRPRGRGLHLAPPPVKEAAIAAGLPTLQPPKASDPEFLAKVSELAPDAIAVVAFGQLIPPNLLALPPLGCVNVHPSLLPRYRGATPMQQALLDGVAETGVTTMYLDEGLDTGDIILQAATPVHPEDNIGDLHDRLAAVGAELLVETLKLVAAGRAPRTPQDDAQATYTKRIRNEDGRLDWSGASTALANRVRAFTPWPGAYAFRNGERLKIWRARAESGEGGSAVGAILAVGPDGIAVQCGSGVLRLLEVQPENGLRMSADAYARGRRIQAGDCLS